MATEGRGLVRAMVAVALRRESRRGAGGDDAQHEIQMVPLLDIVTNVTLFLLATIATVFTSTIPVPAPTHDETPGVEDTLTVSMADTGYVIVAQGGYLQRDCRSFGALAVAVPTPGGAQDPAALTRCLRTMRDAPGNAARFPASHPLQLAGAGGASYGDVVAVLDAVRETQPGARDLFPNVRLGVLR